MWELLTLYSTAHAQGTAQPTEEAANPITEAITSLLGSLPLWATALALLAVFYVLAWIGSNRVGNYLTSHQEEFQTLDTHRGVITLAERLTFLGIFAIGILIALTVSNLMSELGWLLGSLGLAIGFAMQGFLTNFVSGIMLLAQEKTKIGNYVELGDAKGIIREIGMRTTLIQTFEGLEILVPNKQFFEDTVTIHTSNPVRRMSIPVGVGYNSNLEQVIALIMAEIERHQDILQDHPKGVLVKEFTDTCITLNARFWVKSRSAWWVVTSDIMKQIKETFQANGIDFTPLYIYKEVE